MVADHRSLNTCASAHRFGDDLKFMRSRLVVLRFVLHAAVVFEKKLAGLLQNTATLADGAETQRSKPSHISFIMLKN